MYKIFSTILFASLLASTACGAREKNDTIATVLKVSRVDAARANTIVGSHQDMLHQLLLAEPAEITADTEQAFLTSIDPYHYYYVLPVDYMASDSDASHSCAVALFKRNGDIVDAKITFDYIKLGWICEQLLDIGFRHNSNANAVDIVSIYVGRPPSGEVFSYPVKLTIDLSRQTLLVDQDASDYLSANDIESVAAGFKLLAIKPAAR